MIMVTFRRGELVNRKEVPKSVGGGRKNHISECFAYEENKHVEKPKQHFKGSARKLNL